MNKKQWFFILSLLFISSTIKAKNNNYGLRLEFYTYYLERVGTDNSQSYKYPISYLPSFYILYSRQITDELSISIKPGMIISDKDVHSYDLGAFLRMKLPNEKIYFNGGVNALFFRSIGHGVAISEYIESNANYFMSLGTGYNFNKHLSIDLNYFHPFNQKIGVRYDNINHTKTPINLYNMIKLSFEFRT